MDETAHCMQAKIKRAHSFYLTRWLWGARPSGAQSYEMWNRRHLQNQKIVRYVSLNSAECSIPKPCRSDLQLNPNSAECICKLLVEMKFAFHENVIK